MATEPENEFHIGDVVRCKGYTREMTVTSESLGNCTEGIDNGVFCAWSNAEGEHEVVFAQQDLELVRRERV